ncbi:mCG23188, isoform CRA_a, partial [Mus musculus]
RPVRWRGLQRSLINGAERTTVNAPAATNQRLPHTSALANPQRFCSSTPYLGCAEAGAPRAQPGECPEPVPPPAHPRGVLQLQTKENKCQPPPSDPHVSTLCRLTAAATVTIALAKRAKLFSPKGQE